MQVSRSEYDIALGILADLNAGRKPTAKGLMKEHPEWNEKYCKAIISLAKLIKKEQLK